MLILLAGLFGLNHSVSQGSENDTNAKSGLVAELSFQVYSRYREKYLVVGMLMSCEKDDIALAITPHPDEWLPFFLDVIKEHEEFDPKMWASMAHVQKVVDEVNLHLLFYTMGISDGLKLGGSHEVGMCDHATQKAAEWLSERVLKSTE